MYIQSYKSSHTNPVPLILSSQIGSTYIVVYTLSYKYGHTNIILHSMSYITSSTYLVLHMLFYTYCLVDLDMPLFMDLRLPLVRSQHTQFFAFCELSGTKFIVFVISSLFFFYFQFFALHFPIICSNFGRMQSFKGM